ncbi:hypothetical protein ACFV6F_36010 [Kitasatospora phosalacinea]|uniref:hypothetical protein n=1 Tax=Kitasatospora phosalacinea TaxID=2065 RepID=UPI00365B657C
MYDSQLARTGALTLVVGGVAVTGWWLIAAIALPILLGALLVRVGFRSGRTPAE